MSSSESSHQAKSVRGRRATPPTKEAKPAARSRARPVYPALLQHILDSLADGVVVADLDGRFLLFNPAAERILGMGLVEIQPSQWTSVYGCFRSDMVTPHPPEELPLARALRGETVRDAELFIRNRAVPNGVWLSLNATPLRDEGGVVEGGIVVFRDVTDKKRELEQISLLSTAVEQTADSVLITDRDGRIEYVNPAFERLTGYSRAEVLGENPRVLKSGAHSPQFYRELWETLTAGRVFTGAITDRKKSGETFLCEQTITPMRDPGGSISHIVSVAKDITALRRAAQHEGELQLARTVQRRLYPEAPPCLPGFDIFGAAFMADVTGGDYFDFVPLSGDGLGIVIGDVSGHGVDSALLMGVTRAVLRSAAQTTADPSQILAVLNRVLAADTEGNRFTTLLFAVLHPASRTLRYASAGHTPGYLLDGPGRVKVELASTGIPLGLFPDVVFPTSGPIALEPLDTLVLFTDGVTETESPEEEHFGAERALEVVRSCRSERASVIVETLHRAARAFGEDAPQKDDVTAVVCSVDPLP